MLPRSPIAVLLFAVAAAAQPVVTWSAETQRLRSASVTPGSGGAWNVALVMDNDNGNSSLPSSYRRWWHATIGGLRSFGETLAVEIQNPGYTDIILPVWSLSADGVTFGAWQRVPTTAVPKYQGGVHKFTLATPPGTIAIKLAKYFPYGVSARDAWLATIAAHPRVRGLDILGRTRRGYTLPMLEITDPQVPDAGKRRVWVHSGIHPAETTSYFVVEGLVAFLLGGSPAAEVLLDRLIVDIVPMANPEGVALGNYRTNSASVNLENEWGAPYTSAEPEIVALRTRIESLMGTAAQPGSNPIEVLLNLHSTHGFSYPIHYQHTANPSFSLGGNNSGVVPSVNALEGRWIAALRTRSPITALGTTQSSSAGAPSRPFVESMMHDRWSIAPAWTGAPNFLPQVMAITYEGTYGPGASAAWNTPDDWRQVGAAMALAMGDYLGELPGAVVASYGGSCGGLLLSGTATAASLSLTAQGAPGTPLGAWTFGATQLFVPLPPSLCPLRNEALVVVPLGFDALGFGHLALTLPVASALRVQIQALGASQSSGVWSWSTSNGLQLDAAR